MFYDYTAVLLLWLFIFGIPVTVIVTYMLCLSVGWLYTVFVHERQILWKPLNISILEFCICFGIRCRRNFISGLSSVPESNSNGIFWIGLGKTRTSKDFDAYYVCRITIKYAKHCTSYSTYQRSIKTATVYLFNCWLVSLIFDTQCKLFHFY